MREGRPRRPAHHCPSLACMGEIDRSIGGHQTRLRLDRADRDAAAMALVVAETDPDDFQTLIETESNVVTKMLDDECDPACDVLRVSGVCLSVVESAVCGGALVSAGVELGALGRERSRLSRGAGESAAGGRGRAPVGRLGRVSFVARRRGGYDLCEQLSHGWAWAHSFGSQAQARGAHQYFAEPWGTPNCGLAVRGFARWPAFVTAEARRLGVAGAPQNAGLLPEIECAWAALGTVLVLWDYRRGDDFAV